MRVDIPVAVEEDCTSGLVIEVFDDLDKVCAGVVLLHGCPQSWGTMRLAIADAETKVISAEKPEI